MVKLIAIIIFLMHFVCTYAQSLKMGGSFDLMLGNEYLEYEIGPSFNAEYLLKSIPISITGCLRVHFSEPNNDTYKFSWGFTYTIYSVGTIIKCYPIRWDIEPYIGGGLFYNFNDASVSEHPSFINGNLVSPIIDANNISAEISGGIVFSAKSSVNFILEVTQTFNEPKYDLVRDDYEGKLISSEKKTFNFNSFLIKLGVRFGL